jgi:Fic family protein
MEGETVNQKRIPWKPIAELTASGVPSNGGLAALDALRLEWERRLSELSEQDRAQVRQRSLRKLAIETGIIERLYEIEWGLTLTLIAEGFARDVVERHGGTLDDETRTTLEAQRDSLQMVLNYVDEGRRLTVSFIKELHAAITRTQRTYHATDSLGRSVDLELIRGAWKLDPNHVVRGDGALLEYTPPEQVQSEMQRLVELYDKYELDGVHPVTLAAWLHHRFVQIHPFADGNGRVARALVLLVLQKHKFAPLVVDRFHREKYLAALDAANEGDLGALVRLFTNLESATLAAELERPPDVVRGTSIEIAHTLADQLRALRRAQESEYQLKLAPRAVAVGSQIRMWFDQKAKELRGVFGGTEPIDMNVLVDHQLGPDKPRRHWFREQIVAAAHRAGHFAEFASYSGWSGLRLRSDGSTVRFIAAIHGAGRSTGVMAVVTFAELETRWKDEDGESRRDRTLVDTSPDAFRVVYTESIDAVTAREHDLIDLLDEGLSIALAEYIKRLR